MKIKQRKYILVLSIIVGVLIGFLSAKSFFNATWTALILWYLVGLVLGTLCFDRMSVMYSGIIYGILLTVSFLIFGFQGSPDKLVGFIVFALILSIFGALGGLIATFSGYFIGKKLKRL